MRIVSSVAATSAVLIAGVALTFQTGIASAQDTPPAASAETPKDALPDAPASASTVDEVQINKFADAYVAVQSIQKDAAAQPSAAQDAKATEALMVNAIKKTGLQVDEFNQIAQLMNTDLDLRNRIAGKVQERGGS